MYIKGLRKGRDFMFCQYDIIEIALYLDDILEDKKEFIKKEFGEEYDYTSLFTKRSRDSTKDETADIDSIEEKLDSQDKADKIYRKKSIGYNLFYDSLKGYKLSTFCKYKDRNELHEKKKTSRFSKSIYEIEKTILKSRENYIEMEQKKEKSMLNQEENKEFTQIQYFWQNEILCSLYLKTKFRKQMIEENKKKNKREKMSLYSLEECIFFLVILLSPSTRNSIKWKGKKNKTKINHKKKESEETLRFMEIVESTEKALDMILEFLPIIFEDPIFKDSTLQKKKKKGKLNISKHDIDYHIDKSDVADAVRNLFELANLKNTIEIFLD